MLTRSRITSYGSIAANDPPNWGEQFRGFAATAARRARSASRRRGRIEIFEHVP
jgi:hypothetical protein